MLVREIQYPVPPYIRHALDKNSEEHRMNCLAWWLITSKSKEGLESYLAKQSKAARKKITDRLLKAKAWIWLSTLSNQHIRRLLAREGEDRAALKAHLNELKMQYKELLREAV